MTTTSTDSISRNVPSTNWLEVVQRNAANLKFGSIQITVHDGRVTQVESIEKTRFIASREEALKDRK